MRKITIIGPNLGMGGVERASCNLANSFATYPLSVHYLGLIPEEPFYFMDNKVKYKEPQDFNRKKLSLLKTLSFVRKAIENIDPDEIIVFTKFYSALVNLALLGKDKRIFVTERSSPFYEWPFHVKVFCALSFFIKRPRGVISQTTIAASFHKKYYKGIPNAVVPNALREVIRFPNISREKSILAVGRFHDDCKGFDRLVKAFNLVKHEEWRLVFAGGTREEGQYLLNLVKDEATASRIDFLGHVKEIDKVYAQAGIFVIPSRKEGFPNALCEAMAAACPCISFDFTAGPKDIITPGKDGLIVPDGNIEALAEAIDYLIENPSIRQALGHEAMAIADRLQANKIAQMHLDFMFGKEETEVERQS